MDILTHFHIYNILVLMITFTIPALIVMALIAFLVGSIIGGMYIMKKAEGK